LGRAIRVRKSNSLLGACAVTGDLRSLRYLRLKTLLTVAAADGQSASGSPSDTGGEARKIEPQKAQTTQMDLCLAGLRSEPSVPSRPGTA
jgi:hypothetical protein